VRGFNAVRNDHKCRWVVSGGAGGPGLCGLGSGTDRGIERPGSKAHEVWQSRTEKAKGV
jgi:hypothetical protein